MFFMNATRDAPPAPDPGRWTATGPRAGSAIADRFPGISATSASASDCNHRPPALWDIRTSASCANLSVAFTGVGSVAEGRQTSFGPDTSHERPTLFRRGQPPKVTVALAEDPVDSVAVQ